MSVPTPVGRVHYNQPRAVMVREPENLNSSHSAIYSPVHVYVDNKKEADAVLAAWPAIMKILDDALSNVIKDVATTG